MLKVKIYEKDVVKDTWAIGVQSKEDGLVSVIRAAEYYKKKGLSKNELKEVSDTESVTVGNITVKLEEY